MPKPKFSLKPMQLKVSQSKSRNVEYVEEERGVVRQKILTRALGPVDMYKRGGR